MFGGAFDSNERMHTTEIHTILKGTHIEGLIPILIDNGFDEVDDLNDEQIDSMISEHNDATQLKDIIRKALSRKYPLLYGGVRSSCATKRIPSAQRNKMVTPKRHVEDEEGSSHSQTVQDNAPPSKSARRSLWLSKPEEEITTTASSNNVCNKTTTSTETDDATVIQMNVLDTPSPSSPPPRKNIPVSAAIQSVNVMIITSSLSSPIQPPVQPPVKITTTNIKKRSVKEKTTKKTTSTETTSPRNPSLRHSSPEMQAQIVNSDASASVTSQQSARQPKKKKNDVNTVRSASPHHDQPTVTALIAPRITDDHCCTTKQQENEENHMLDISRSFWIEVNADSVPVDTLNGLQVAINIDGSCGDVGGVRTTLLAPMSNIIPVMGNSVIDSISPTTVCITKV
jgi:hypothetical protein